MSASYGAASLQSAGPSISLDGGSGTGGVGTYKGVMLCNRPFGGTEGAAQKASGESNTFRTGKVPDMVGVVSANVRDKIKRPKKENALTRHRKWLAELQRTKDRLEAEYTVEKIKEQKKTERFQKGEEKMRKAAKAMMKDIEDASSKASLDGPETNEVSISTLGSPEGVSDAKSFGVNPSDSEMSKEVEALLAKAKAEAKDSQAQTIAESKVSAGKNAKPAWAFASEDDAAEAKEAKEFDDDEGLLDFAAGLDFEKYVDDMEVQTMLAQVAARIRQLEREVKDEGARDAEAIERQALREQLAAMGEDVSLDTGMDTGESSGDARAFAKQVLADMDELKGVHSTQSVAQLYTKAKEDAEIKKEVTIAAPVAVAGTTALDHAGTPVIAVHDDSEGAREKEKNSVRKLPYMNRNPAV
jgi:hypothetical protein